MLHVKSPHPGSGATLHATNIGNGIAIKIICTCRNIGSEDVLDKMKATRDLMQSKECSEFVRTFVDVDNPTLPKFFDANFNPMGEGGNLEVKLHYSDLLGNAYQSIYDVKSRSVTLRSYGKVNK